MRGVLDPADYLTTLNITTFPYTSLLLLIDRVGSAGSVVARGVYWVPSGEIPGLILLLLILLLLLLLLLLLRLLLLLLLLLLRADRTPAGCP